MSASTHAAALVRIPGDGSEEGRTISLPEYRFKSDAKGKDVTVKLASAERFGRAYIDGLAPGPALWTSAMPLDSSALHGIAKASESYIGEDIAAMVRWFWPDVTWAVGNKWVLLPLGRAEVRITYGFSRWRCVAMVAPLENSPTSREPSR